MYNENKAVYLCPVKINPAGFWIGAMEIRKDCVDLYNNSFDNVINHFMFYNCDNERGKYIAFYKREAAK